MAPPPVLVAVLLAACLPWARGYSVSNLAASVTSSVDIVVTWTAPSSTQVTGYLLYLDRTDGLATENNPEISVNGRTTQTYTFSNNAYYAQYTVNVQCVSSSGTNNNVSVSATTDPTLPQIAPPNVAAVAVTVDTINVTWSEIPEISKKGVMQGHTLTYRQLTNSRATTVSLAATEFTSTLTGLSQGSTYLITVYASNTVGDSPSTSIVETTLGAFASVTTDNTTTENKTRYYCNELIPGSIEFAWEEMPCWYYLIPICLLCGAVGLLVVLSCLCDGLMCICKACKKNNDVEHCDGDFDDHSEKSEVPPMVIIQNFNNAPSKTPRSTFTQAVTARDVEPDVANMSDFEEEEDEWDSDPPPPKKSVTIAPPPGTMEDDGDDDW